MFFNHLEAPIYAILIDEGKKEEVYKLFYCTVMFANVSAKVSRNGLVGKAVCLSLC
jgi:hypothetical protein